MVRMCDILVRMCDIMVRMCDIMVRICDLWFGRAAGCSIARTRACMLACLCARVYQPDEGEAAVHDGHPGALVHLPCSDELELGAGVAY